MATADSDVAGGRYRPRPKLASEIVPEQVLPKVLSTFDGISLYVYIIFFINASAIIALGGWSTTQFQILGVIVFMIPSAMAVAELGGVWPAEGGIYVWASKTMPGWLAFFGGFFSWAPIILNAATHPAVIVALIELAFPSFLPNTTASVLLYLVFMWIQICIALMKLRVSRNAANTSCTTWGSWRWSSGLESISRYLRGIRLTLYIRTCSRRSTSRYTDHTSA